MIRVMQRAEELADAILASDVYGRMLDAQAAVDASEEATRFVAAYTAARGRAEKAAREMDREALPGAMDALRAAEERMNAVPEVAALRAAREAFDDMMDSVNRVLRLRINGTPDDGAPAGCGGNCAACAGCR